MLYSTVKWAGELHSKGLYKYSGVTKGKSSDTITFTDWAALIKDNFERCYYVPASPSQDSKYNVDPAIINRRGIYKDLYLSGKPYEDYQLRPNFPIAMICAPDLFTPDFARGALAVADEVLRGPTGMATLDPSDLNYRPNYNNNEDSTDFATSKGRNYHQGPEWIWPRGYFLRALLKFDLMRRTTPEGRVESFQQVTRRLKGCQEAIRTSDWAGLTELTNQNGAFCADSVCLFPCSVRMCLRGLLTLSASAVAYAGLVGLVSYRLVPRRAGTPGGDLGAGFVFDWEIRAES
jgi:glycogen debranching enzyme